MNDYYYSTLEAVIINIIIIITINLKDGLGYSKVIAWTIRDVCHIRYIFFNINISEKPRAQNSRQHRSAILLEITSTHRAAVTLTLCLYTVE